LSACSPVTDLNARAGAEIADRTRDEDLSGRRRGRDTGREMDIDSSDRAARPFDLAYMNARSDP